jgi:hypothetical protein
MLAVCNKKDFSDISFIVGDQTYYGHKAVICARSEYFAKMIGPNSTWQESKEKSLKIQDVAPKVFLAYLEFLYSDKVCDLHLLFSVSVAYLSC